ncbi:MAG TPA: TetR/AcrR family transcriptional regulator [Acidimicrobiia bacterium]|jgi:AcrR family transcriptional regulator
MAQTLTPATTRDRLVDAAIAVFREQGYERARVQDIARAAGLTTGAIYANFRDKRELLLAAISAGSAAEVETLLRASDDLAPRDVLRALGNRMAFSTSGRPLLIEAIVAAQRDPELANLLRTALTRRQDGFVQLVERGRDDGTIATDIDTDTLARFCVLLALGSLVARTLELETQRPKEWETLIERLLDAFSPQEQA